MALHYELEVLEELIKESLHPKNFLTGNPITTLQFETWSQLLLQEKETVKKRLKKVTYGYSKETHRNLYIKQHQFAIIHLKNVLMDFLMPRDAVSLIENTTDEWQVKLYKRSLGAMRELLVFIRDEFPQYFNYEEKVPGSSLLSVQDGYKLRLTKLHNQLTKAGNDSALIELVIQTIIIHIHNETCQPLTYSKLSYLKILMSGLEKMNPEESYSSYYSPLVALLVYMNFNVTVFKNHFVKLIHADIDAGTTMQDKIERISFHHKEISQLAVKPGMTMIPAFPSVQLDLVTWLFNEMAHLEKKQTLGMVVPVEFKDKENDDKEKGIYSLYTIEEMGLLLKAHHETELIRNKNLKQAAKSMAEHWHSKYKENISWQYLYNSMSTIEMNTIKSLEDKLVGMVNWLRKVRGRLK
jgi:hypothetical protein